jgi:hypothetical protein
LDLITSLGGEVVGPFGRVADALNAVRRQAADGAFLDVRLDGDTTFKIADPLLHAANPILFVTRGAADSIPWSIGNCRAFRSHLTTSNSRAWPN